MSIFYLVKGNVKHNGVYFEKGSIVNGNQDEFSCLVNDGLFEVIDGAESEEEAQEIVKTQEQVLNDSKKAEVKDPGTWGPWPKKEETVESSEEEVKEEVEEADEEVDSSEEEEDEE